MDERFQAGVSLPFGRGDLHSPLPDGWGLDLIAPLGPGDLPDPEQALRAVVESPIDSAPLSELIPKKGRVLIMLPDGTRKDGKRELLPWLLGMLDEWGARGDRVHLMIAPGTHRALSQSELAELIGPDLFDRHPVFQHDCDGPHRKLGQTSRGTPIELDERLWDYQLILPVTGVLHHYFAGFSGGRKLLVPGAASRATIEANHRLVLLEAEAGGGRRPGVGPGRLSGNPLAEDLAEAAQAFPLPVFLLALIRGRRPGAFAGFWAGDLFKAHLAACKTYLGWKTHHFETPYDLVLSASGGHPLDGNLIQAHKGLDDAFRLVRPGGVIVYAAACDDGLGGAGLEPWLAIDDLARYERRLVDQYEIYAQTVWALKQKAAQARIVLVSNLDGDSVSSLGMQPATDLVQALDIVIPDLPNKHTTALFPDAASLLPVRKTGVR